MKDFQKKNPRRQFINNGVTKGIGIVAGLGILAHTKENQDKSEEVIRMIDSNGTLYEVEKKHMNKMCQGKVSNSQLKNWIDSDRLMNK